jgi:ferredoxin-thioredoxin reductase catalytic subunit
VRKSGWLVIPITDARDRVPIAANPHMQSCARGAAMEKDRESILALLKGELEFINSGGFRYCPRSPWCAPHSFNEYACPSLSEIPSSARCKECWLMQFIAPEHRDGEMPCRFVQLTASGANVDSLCRYNTPAELEQTLRRWLDQRIHEVECVR